MILIVFVANKKMKIAHSFWLTFFLVISAPNSTAEPNNSLADFNQQAKQYETKQNYPKALQLYCIAAALGSAEASYNLGWMHFNGRGVKPSQALAVGWFKRAAHLGDTFAANMLERLKETPGKKDSSCPTLSQKRKPSKSQIKIWARIIALTHEIDPELVLAVIQTESAFKIKAHSVKNAQGLMQLIPKTAQRFGVTDSWNPVENILGGVTYINWLMRYFEGDVRSVLAAYNAGEEAVNRYKGIPPYPETQQYVKKIMARYKREKHPVPPV